MTQDIFIGIDGGGTKTKVRVEDAAGRLLGQAIGGPSNIGHSVETAWASIYSALEKALNPARIQLEDKNYRFHVGMGLAGCEIPEAYSTFVNTPHLFTTLILKSDAHTACMGAHADNEGTIIIIGTGVIGYQIQAGQGMRVSGWGFPHDDEGGGAWLGLEAAKLTFQWIDHRVEKSPLFEDIFDFFNRDFNYFVAWANRANSTEYARLAPLVINHSQQEEFQAVRLLKKAAHAIDRVAVALEKMRMIKNSVLPCALFGGIAPFIEPYLNQDVRANLVTRKGDAITGALLLIRKEVAKLTKEEMVK